MRDDPYRDDREATLMRVAELEGENERLHHELESARVPDPRAMDKRLRDMEATEKVLRTANEELRRENDELCDRLARALGNGPVARRVVSESIVRRVQEIASAVVVLALMLVYFVLWMLPGHR
jgi:hypothetical protein